MDNSFLFENNEIDDFFKNEINEECGVFGVFETEDSASLTYFGLHALQHRGQEGCGIASSDGKHVTCVKGRGLLTEVFNSEKISKIEGLSAIGHVRYSTANGNIIENVQPLMVRAHTGEFAVCHNGQIVNAKELKRELEDEGSIFQGTGDSEILVHLIQREKGNMIQKIKKACNKIEGAFAFVIITKDRMYAIRDKNGLRPLAIAKLNNGYCISSETCAFDIVNAEFIRDIEPGEIIKLKKGNLESFKYTNNTQRKTCAMEYIYFARPDSVIDNINVHNFRKECGKVLARKDPYEAEIVIGVPDSSISAAIGFAEESGLPYEIGLIKNRYVARTFIQPTQKQRERGVRMKLSAISSIVKDKRVVMVDDSIVRGTTSKRIVQLLFDAGAKEVHVRIGAPEFLSPCFYGVDTSTYEELISARMNVEKLKDYIGATSLIFMSINEIKQVAKSNELCLSCFDGKYPTELFSLGKILKK